MSLKFVRRLKLPISRLHLAGRVIRVWGKPEGNDGKSNDARLPFA